MLFYLLLKSWQQTKHVKLPRVWHHIHTLYFSHVIVQIAIIVSYLFLYYKTELLSKTALEIGLLPMDIFCKYFKI